MAAGTTKFLTYISHGRNYQDLNSDPDPSYVPIVESFGCLYGSEKERKATNSKHHYWRNREKVLARKKAKRKPLSKEQRYAAYCKEKSSHDYCQRRYAKLKSNPERMERQREAVRRHRAKKLVPAP